MNKVYIIRKYVVAKSVKHAISLDKKTDIDDCFLEESSQKIVIEDLTRKDDRKIGFIKKLK